MRFLLDTCVLSDFAAGQPTTMERVRSAAPEDLAASVITRMEISYGLLLNPVRARRVQRPIDDLFDTITVLPYAEQDAEATAVIRASLKRRGRPIGAYDLLITGTALAHDLTLVTSNLREFEQIADLRIEDWRS
jgi:tRNA(fMet)-specific endonuclease VapC